MKQRWSSFLAYLGCAAVSAAAFLPWLFRVLRFRNELYSSRHLNWIPRPGLEDGLSILFRNWLLSVGSSRRLVKTDDLEVVEVRLAQEGPTSVEPATRGDR